MLCEQCSNIHFRQLTDCDLIKEEPERLLVAGTKEGSGSVFYFHHSSRDKLQVSSEHGCHFCGMLLDRLFGDKGGSFYSREHSFARGAVIFEREIVEQWISKENGLEGWNRDDWIYVQCGNRRTTSTSHGKYSGLLELMLDVLTDCPSMETLELQGRSSYEPVSTLINRSDEIAEADLRTVPPEFLQVDTAAFSPWLEVSTMSISNMLLASFWLQSCMLKHKVCSDLQKTGRLPKRIINIKNSRKIKLEEGLDREEQYVTLSYKWGETARYVTTVENLDVHTRKGIPSTKLPRTFEDAIFVASSLGFRWIWIDALCICQNDPDELAQEVNKMDQIFRTSTLTLFATAGESADSGSMSMRDPRWVKPCRLNMKTTLGSQTVEGSTYVSLDRGENTSSPLYDRGWVLQEQVLAHRALIFESRQIRWRCLCGYASELYPSKTSERNFSTIADIGTSQYGSHIAYSKGFDGFDHLRLWTLSKDAMPNRAPWQRDNQFDAWYSMIANYHSRALSHESDVLAAIAGLSNAIAEIHGCTYYAGLWKEDLQTGLCWYVTGSKNVESYATTSCKECLPSWTWISQRGKHIQFRDWENNHYVIKQEGVVLLAGLDSQSSQVSAKSGGILPSIRPRELVVNGRLREIAIEEIPPWDSDWQDSRTERTTTIHSDLSAAQWVWRVRDIATKEKLGHIAFDCIPGQTQQSEIYCLLCLVREKYGQWQLTCLALVPVDWSMTKFKRIGLIMLRDKNWFGELQSWPEYGHSKPSSELRHRDTVYHRTIRLV